MVKSEPSWQKARDDLAAVPAGDKEIRIGGHHDWVGHGFAHAYEASIRKAHGHAGVFVHEREHRAQLIAQTVNYANASVPQQAAQPGSFGPR